MSKAELAQVLDRDALDASSGTQARLKLTIPSGWAREGGDLEFTVPARLTCGRCDGGGCDGCARSGAHRAPDDPAARALRMRLPACQDGCVVVRLVRPFGEGGALDQLLVELRAADDGASPGVVRVAPVDALPLALPSRLYAPTVLTVLAVLAALVGLVASR